MTQSKKNTEIFILLFLLFLEHLFQTNQYL